MKLAIISCARLPKGVAEDQPLFIALQQHPDINYDICIWDDPHINWEQYDVCLLRSVWDYHEKSEAFMRWIRSASAVTKIINPPEVIQWNSNKLYLRAMQEHGLPIAPTLWLKQHKDCLLSSAIQQLPESERYFLKPTIGADSSGTFRFNPSQLNSAQVHLDQWLQSHDMMLQCYLPSVESYGEISAIYIGDQFSHAIRKTPVNGDYRVQDTFGATDQAHILTTDERTVSNAAMIYLIKKMGPLSYARIDMLINKNQVVINEVELIEPSLFFHHHPIAAQRLINQLQSLV